MCPVVACQADGTISVCSYIYTELEKIILTRYGETVSNPFFLLFTGCFHALILYGGFEFDTPVSIVGQGIGPSEKGELAFCHTVAEDNFAFRIEWSNVHPVLRINPVNLDLKMPAFY